MFKLAIELRDDGLQCRGEMTEHTTAGAFPPSSRRHGLRCRPASAAMILPTRSLPVNYCHPCLCLSNCVV